MTKMSILCSTILLIVLALTPRNNAANEFQQMLCEMAHPELKQCTLQCREGRAWKDGCPTCMCRSALCQQIRCSLGEICTIEEKVGAIAGQFTNVAVCVIDNRNLWPTHTTVGVPTSPFLGSCDFQGRCDANGRCASKDSVCRQDGLCCKIKGLTGYNLERASADMTRCMDTPEVGPCRALGTQYVYKKETGKCENMTYGGCVSSRNSFATMELCQKTCEHPCQKPKTLGRCRASLPRFYFNEEKEACEAFDLGGCAGTAANYFMTPWECETHCKGLKKKDRGIEGTTVPTPQTFIPISGHQNDRDILTKKIIDNFWRREPQVQDRIGQPTHVGDENKVNYNPRPQQGGGYYQVDANGNRYYVSYTDRPRPTSTVIPTYRTNGDDGYTHLGDRIRSAQQIFSNFRRGQVNYTNPRLRALPVYRDRRTRPYTPQYQRSADALRRFYS